MFNRKHQITCLASVLTLVALAGCSNESDASKQQDGLSTVTIAASTGGPFPQNLNPVGPASGLHNVRSFVYEPLLQFNKLKPKEVIPWLATDYTWSNDGRQLTFKTRQGVKWSDGKPFSSADAAFTFSYVKQYPEINGNGLAIETVTAPDDTTVQLTFKDPSYANLFYIGTQLILPKHVWQSIDKPATAPNMKPVGTGPYLVERFTPQQITLKRSTSYWQKGKPQIDRVVFPSTTDNNGPGVALTQGKADWGGVFFPGLKSYVEKDPKHHKYWFPPMSNTVLILNLKKAPMNSLPLRKAINLALDRQAITDASTLGLVPVVENPTMLTPFQFADLNPKYKDQVLKPNVDEAKSVLTAAGYSYSGSQLVSPEGKPVRLRFTSPGPLSDLVASGQEIAKQLEQIGIKVDIVSVSVAQWDGDQSSGNYEMALRPSPAGPGPYYMYNYWLNGKLTAPVGKPATANYSRWTDARTDSLLNQYATTDDPEVQRQALWGLQEIVVEQLPVIPVQYQAFWGEYNTKNIVGWPDPKNPYALSSVYDVPANEMVILNLRPRKG